MTEGLADRHDRATSRHETLYRSWSQGGAGLLLTGNVMVDRRFLERPGNVVIDQNGGLEALQAWARAGTEAGNHLWMQLSHPGRQCGRLVSAHPMAPSAVQLNMLGNFGRPRVMSESDIQAVIADFARAAGIARETGFTGVQVHGAHGYLLSQFLSPVVNRRTDQWGGELQNRARLLLASVRAVRAAVGPDFPVSVKLNSADFQKGGFTLEESQQVARWLEEEGIDLLEISGGTYEQLRLLGRTGRDDQVDEPQRESTRQREAYFLDYAQRIRAAVSLPLAVTGGFRQRASMEQAVASGEIDVVGLARPLCTDPETPWRLLEQRCERTAEHELRLRLGAGWLGPSSANIIVKQLNALGTVAWYYRQLLAMADGRPLPLNLSLGRALLAHLFSEFRLAMRRKGAMRADGYARVP